MLIFEIPPWFNFKDPWRIFLILFKRKYFSSPDLTLQVKIFFFYHDQLPKLSFRHLMEYDNRLGKEFYLCKPEPGQCLTETAMIMTMKSRTAKAMERRQHFIFLARSWEEKNKRINPGRLNTQGNVIFPLKKEFGPSWINIENLSIFLDWLILLDNPDSLDKIPFFYTTFLLLKPLRHMNFQALLGGMNLGKVPQFGFGLEVLELPGENCPL